MSSWEESQSPPLIEEPFACIYLLSKGPCLVLAEGLHALTHVLVRGQRELHGTLSHLWNQSKQHHSMSGKCWSGNDRTFREIQNAQVPPPLFQLSPMCPLPWG